MLLSTAKLTSVRDDFSTVLKIFQLPCLHMTQQSDIKTALKQQTLTTARLQENGEM